VRSSGDSAGLGSRVSAPHGEECRKRSSFVIVAHNGSEYTFWTSPLAKTHGIASTSAISTTTGRAVFAFAPDCLIHYQVGYLGCLKG
jgi:hypothetical protein